MRRVAARAKDGGPRAVAVQAHALGLGLGSGFSGVGWG
jgi:hypothetical protein